MTLPSPRASRRTVMGPPSTVKLVSTAKCTSTPPISHGRMDIAVARWYAKRGETKKILDSTAPEPQASVDQLPKKIAGELPSVDHDCHQLMINPRRFARGSMGFQGIFICGACIAEDVLRLSIDVLQWLLVLKARNLVAPSTATIVSPPLTRAVRRKKQNRQLQLNDCPAPPGGCARRNPPPHVRRACS